MRVERLFGVLVLGGAALAGGCGGGDPDDSESTEGSNTQGTGSGGDHATGGTSGGTPGGSGGGGTSAGDSGTPQCSAEPSPIDPCGCACCWVSDCLNDEECCRSFCDAADDARGCCPP